MKLIIITGMSGAGKSQVANVLEDRGFFCVDNIPPQIIPTFVSMAEMGNEKLKNMAIVTDVRGGEMFAEIPKVINEIRKKNIELNILFLDADDEVLINRYKENRRTHPLCDQKGLSLPEAVKIERETLKEIKEISDYVIDTGKFSINELTEKINERIFGEAIGGITVICKSFGFKYGPDEDADLVLDVRCLPNPYYVEELKTKTGLQKEVRDYIFQFSESKEFEKKVFDILDFSLPLYLKEGKTRLVIDFGCTGGKHRSVTFAERTAKHLKKQGYTVKTVHRDIGK